MESTDVGTCPSGVIYIAIATFPCGAMMNLACLRRRPANGRPRLARLQAGEPRPSSLFRWTEFQASRPVGAFFLAFLEFPLPELPRKQSHSVSRLVFPCQRPAPSIALHPRSGKARSERPDFPNGGGYW